MVDAASAFIDVNDSMKTTSFLRDIDEMVAKHGANTNSSQDPNFIITEEEKAKIECLKGQVTNYMFLD